MVLTNLQLSIVFVIFVSIYEGLVKEAYERHNAPREKDIPNTDAADSKDARTSATLPYCQQVRAIIPKSATPFAVHDARNLITSDVTS